MTEPDRPCLTCGALIHFDGGGHHKESLATFRRRNCSHRCAQLSHVHEKPWSETPTNQAWKNARKRCRNPKNEGFARYGGRGITVCERWDVFANFLTDMGECPKGMSLDRINNDGNYEPGNCRWATQSTQSRNRSNNRYLEHNGERRVIADWAKAYGLATETLNGRLRRGMTVHEALTTPLRQRGAR